MFEDRETPEVNPIIVDVRVYEAQLHGSIEVVGTTDDGRTLKCLLLVDALKAMVREGHEKRLFKIGVKPRFRVNWIQPSLN